MTIKEQAKFYLSLGWSIIPLQAGKKTPTIAWMKYREQYMTEAEVDKYFSEDTNIAVVCGKLSGIMVIDQDFYKGDVDLEAFKGIDSPLKSITGRGGVHLFFKYQEGTQNTVNEKVKADVRSEGGYVVIPPSKVEFEEGRKGTYAWFTKPDAKLLAEDLPEAPKLLLEMLYNLNTTLPTNDYKKTPENALGSSINGLSEGGRNNAISQKSLSALSRGMSEDEALVFIQGVNQTFNPPLPEKELRRTFESAVRKNRESPSISKNQKSVSQAPKEISTSISSLTTNDDLDSVIGELMAGQQKGVPTGIKFLDETMGGLIPGQSYLLFADTSVGKSMFAVNILTSLAENGTQTMYFDLENDMKMTMERMTFSFHAGKLSLSDYRKVLNENPVDEKKLRQIFEPVNKYSEKLHVWDLNKLIKRFGDVTWAGVKQCMEEQLSKGDVRVVVIDHLHYFSPAETDHSILGEIARQINNVAAQYNVAVLLVAHTKKGLLETNKKDDSVKAIRPTVDHISGSGMIAKHFKNIMALKRNTVANDPYDRSKTQLYVDKTKFGPAGSTEIFYCENTLVFTDNANNVVMVKAHTQMEGELQNLSNSTKLPVSKHEKPVTLGEAKAQAEKKITPEPIVVAKEEPKKDIFVSAKEKDKEYDDYKHPDLQDLPF